MRKLIRGMMLLAGACLMAGVIASCQAPEPLTRKPAPNDLAVTFDMARANLTTGSSFWMKGGSVQLHGQLWRSVGVVADVAGMHIANIDKSGVGLDLVTATLGPRYTWAKPHARSSFFGQALGGEAFGFNSSFPRAGNATSHSNSLAMRLGGGMDFSLSRRIAVRAVEANWLRTQTPNVTTSVQNNLVLGSGIKYRF